MKCIIIDDEPLARQEMQSLIEEVSNLEIVGSFPSVLKASEFIISNTIDIVFLDIEMPMISGLEFALHIPEKTQIIFTTAYPQYAIKSYEINATDYLLKPIDSQRLKKAIEKAELHTKLYLETTPPPEPTDYLFIRSDRRNFKILFKDILFIEGLKDYVIIHTLQQKRITALNLKAIQKKLVSPVFLRVNKSYIVNMDYIESFDHTSIYLKEFQIPLGETYKTEFIDRYIGDSLTP